MIHWPFLNVFLLLLRRVVEALQSSLGVQVAQLTAAQAAAKQQVEALEGSAEKSKAELAQEIAAVRLAGMSERANSPRPGGDM